MVSASDDATARVWEIPSGRLVGEPIRHARWIRYACFSPEGKRILTASQDSTARIWDAATGRPLIPPLVHHQLVVAASFSPDGRWVATASFDKTARVWDAFTGEPVGEPLRHRSTVRSVAFSPEGLRVVTASEDGTARIWDASTGAPVTEPMGHGGIVWSACFSSDGQRVVTASADGTARLWEVRPGQAVVLRLPHTSGVNWAQWSADGRWAYTCASGMWSWSTTNGVNRHFQEFYDGAGWPSYSTASVSPDGQHFATVIDTNRICLWDLSGTDSKSVEPDLRHAAAVNTLAFSPDNRWLVTASADRTAQVWDVAARKSIGQPLRHEDVVFDAQFSPDGQFVVTASADHTACVWSAANGSLVFPPLRHAGTVVMARFSPDGRWIATASADRTARIWDARNGRPKGPLLAHNGEVNAVQFSPDSSRLVTASRDNTAQVWQVPSGRPAGEPLTHEDSVAMAEFSPDGCWVLTASRDGTARLWDAASGRPVAEPLKHTRRITAAHFSPDGRWVITASDDRTAVIWRLLRPRSAPPTWLAELAEAVAGKRLKSTGLTEETPAGEWFRLKQEREQNRGPDDYERWAIWFFADRSRRAIAPDASMTVAGLIKERVRLACHLLPDQPSWLEEALRYEPASALCLARLAQVQARWNSSVSASTLVQLDWLTRTAMELAPDEPLVQWARALALARRSDTAGALQLMERVRQAGFEETCFLVDYTDLLVQARRLPEAYAVFEAALKWEPESESRIEAYMRKNYRANWAGKLTRTQPDKALRVFDFAIQYLPPPRPDTPPQTVDLTTNYHNTLAALWFYSGAHLDGLSDFVDSPIHLEGIVFDVRGYILATDQSPQSAQSKDIHVRRLCRRVHLLQTAWATWPPGTRLGSYRVHFADGDRREIPIVYGRDLGVFVNHPAATEEAATVAWEHQSTDGARLRLYRLTWDNPRPGIVIDHIEFIAERKTGEPALLAVTVEP